MQRLLIFLGACSAGMSVLVISALVMADPVFKLGTNSVLKNYFSNDKNDWWKELPIKILPIRSGIFNQEGIEAVEENLRLLVSGRSILGDLPIAAVSHSKEWSVEIILSKYTTDCGIITDEVWLKRRGFTDINEDGIAEQCVFLGRAERSDTCHLGTGNFLGYGDWYVLGKRTVKSNVKLLEVRESECGVKGVQGNAG